MMTIEKVLKKLSGKSGYNKKEIENIERVVSRTSREEVRRGVKKKKQQEGIMYISKYENHAGIFKQTIKKWWKILQADEKYGKLFKQQLRFLKPWLTI